MAQIVNVPVDYELTTPVEMTFKKSGAEDRVEEITTLRIRPMIVGDLRMMDNFKDKKVSGAIALAARLTGQSEAVIEKLSMVDFNTVNEIIGRFLPKDPGTGETE